MSYSREDVQQLRERGGREKTGRYEVSECDGLAVEDAVTNDEEQTGGRLGAAAEFVCPSLALE